VFPNPTSSVAYVNFSLEANSDVKVIVTDAIGRTVNVMEKNDMETGMHRLNVDMSQQASGVYNVTIQTESGKISARLSVVK
ncbi:MAG: T9SS type A sorting domain-containing protein, partial [Taibaiella sp.]|nr:T9SS type A sorting domain-containing protein [Taibaiella sp.]